MNNLTTTFNAHLWRQHRLSKQPIEISILLTQMGFAAKVLSREISRAALVGRLGLVGEKNATGDAQKKLDVFSNQVVVEAFSDIGLVAAIASEELDQVQLIECGQDAQYILCTDPLDGSSNIDTGSAVGTIFGIYRRSSTGYCSTEADALQPGTELVAAGYVLYGTSTMLVYTTGDQVDGFTLDPTLGEFLLSHENIRCPDQGKTYSANLSYYQEWHPHLQKLVDYLGDHKSTSHAAHTLRYSGALVADVHRCLLEGGLYFYPSTEEQPLGKLRLLYECAPLAFVVEQAGGLATSGTERIMDIEVTSIHQRSPLAIGSAAAVKLYENFLEQGMPT
ncbi:Fructose-1,6-bisphosphatase class 1 [Acaryochloris thomasi RCC1774]|uniref:Fructose-1,6-bisphosphatase class 1 n=1 Tax=Acaryochloris thomasi RCC1774 TaxID=1764569 RepID=A0A2W1JM19_9CYAN|nr:class 1 fructose-bisphosphatase [Acaryochloris thomasi]PZD71194.1 Fructose-1,6-bisphosphatase class 1 [Acaryochloris thomasi RCC1774]